MWIRSQAKSRLIYCTKIGIEVNYDEFKVVDFSSVPYSVLGTYKSKERAIEVLDEIQENMLKNAVAKVVEGEEQCFISNPVIIYQMPEEVYKDVDKKSN